MYNSTIEKEEFKTSITNFSDEKIKEIMNFKVNSSETAVISYNNKPDDNQREFSIPSSIFKDEIECESSNTKYDNSEFKRKSVQVQEDNEPITQFKGFILSYLEDKRVECYFKNEGKRFDCYIPEEEFIEAGVEISSGEPFILKVKEINGFKKVIIEKDDNSDNEELSPEVIKLKKEIEEYLL